MILSSPQVQASDRKAWAGAIASPAVEFAKVPLPVLAGRLPEGLKGTLYRNGPARLERGGERVGHWFDGDGAVLAVRFTESGAVGTHRYVRSAGYEAETDSDRLLYRGYGTLPSGGLVRRLQSQLKNPANTSVLALPETLLALWEGGLPHALDPDTLETLGLETLGSLGGSRPYSAHPKRHPRTGDIFNFGLGAGANAVLNLYRSGADGQIQQQESLDLNGIPLVHDFVLADRYLVFCVPPVRLNALPAVLALQSFSDALIWQPKRGTQIVVVDADSFEVVAWNQVEPWFQWHFGNGYLDAGGDIVMDVVAYPDFATNRNLKEIASGKIQTNAPSQLWRLRLDPHTAEIKERQVLIERHCEFPVVESGVAAPAAATFVNLHRPGEELSGEFFGAIARLDPQTQALTVANAGANCYPCEPIYAAHCEAETGWILTVVYDGNRHASEVWIYESDHLDQEPVCRLGLPKVVPHSFHGAWRSDKKQKR